MRYAFMRLRYTSVATAAYGIAALAWAVRSCYARAAYAVAEQLAPAPADAH